MRVKPHRKGMVSCAIYVDIHELPTIAAVTPTFAVMLARLDRAHPGVHFVCHPIMALGHRVEIRVSEGDVRPPDGLAGGALRECDVAVGEAIAGARGC